MGTPPTNCKQTSVHDTSVCLRPTKIAPSGRVLRSSGRAIIPSVSPANSDEYPSSIKMRARIRLFTIAMIGISCGVIVSLALPQLDYSMATESSRSMLAAVRSNLMRSEKGPLHDGRVSPRQARVEQAVQRVTTQLEDELERILISPRPKQVASSERLARFHVDTPKVSAGAEPVRRVETQKTPLSHVITHSSRALVGRVDSVIKKYATKHKSPSQLAHAIVQESTRQGVDPLFVAAVIKSESTFNSSARSHKGAQGLMQIMPATGAWLTAKHDLPRGKLTDPGHNLRLGISYLKQLEESYNGNRVFALVAYNWGPGHVDSAAGGKRKIPKECMQYALKIIQDYKRWSSGVI
jgi:hypothetical protein